ncbi:hypothetical protein EV363DRAFT_1298796 [Boletus edulis]|nr:hypothetical protein EV363DRAFT_1298796 [Boletus edulis]
MNTTIEIESRSVLGPSASRRRSEVEKRTAPTGRPHIGYYVPLTKIADCFRVCVEVNSFSLMSTPFLDNLEAPLDLVTHRTKYYEFVLRAIFTSLSIPTSKLTFVESPLLSGLIYPGLQALDEQYLGIDFQFGDGRPPQKRTVPNDVEGQTPGTPTFATLEQPEWTGDHALPAELAASPPSNVPTELDIARSSLGNPREREDRFYKLPEHFEAYYKIWNDYCNESNTIVLNTDAANCIRALLRSPPLDLNSTAPTALPMTFPWQIGNLLDHHTLQQSALLYLYADTAHQATTRSNAATTTASCASLSRGSK